MAEEMQEPSMKVRKGWKIPLLLASLIAIGVGILVPIFVFREARGPADILNKASTLRGSSGALVVGIIGLLRCSFWTRMGQQAVIRGGLISGALLSLALLTKVGVIYFLMAPLGGFAAVKYRLQQSLNGVSLRQATSIGLRSGIVAAIVAFVLAVPVALFVNDRLNTAYASWASLDALGVFAGRTPPMPFSTAGTMGGALALSILGVGLSALAGALCGKIRQHSKKSA